MELVKNSAVLEFSQLIVNEIKRSTRSVPSNEEIVEQAKLLCKEYVSNKLRKLSLLDDTLKEQYSSLIFLTTTSEASKEMQFVGEELESMYPDLYRNVFKQLNISFVTEDILRRSYTLFAEHLCKDGIHWGKIVALFAMTGAFAEDCMLVGHPEYIGQLVEMFGNFVSHRLTRWISYQGGWTLPNVIKNASGKEDNAPLWTLGVMGAAVGFVIALILVLRL